MLKATVKVVTSLCVAPAAALVCHRAEAQDVGDPAWFARSGRVTSAGESMIFLPRGASPGALRFTAARSVRVDPVEHPREQAPDLSQAPLHATPPFPSRRGTSRARWGRGGFCGVLPCCRWTSSSTRAAAGAPGAAGAAQRVLVWSISSHVSGRAVVSPGRHQPGRFKRTPCGSS